MNAIRQAIADALKAMARIIEPEVAGGPKPTK